MFPLLSPTYFTQLNIRRRGGHYLGAVIVGWRPVLANQIASGVVAVAEIEKYPISADQGTGYALYFGHRSFLSINRSCQDNIAWMLQQQQYYQLSKTVRQLIKLTFLQANLHERFISIIDNAYLTAAIVRTIGLEDLQ